MCTKINKNQLVRSAIEYPAIGKIAIQVSSYLGVPFVFFGPLALLTPGSKDTRVYSGDAFIFVFFGTFFGKKFGRYSYQYITLYNFEEADLLLFTTFRKNLRFGEAERALMQ